MIIAITGTSGAGKDTVVDYLVQTRGFYHASARRYLEREIEKRGMPMNRDSMIAVADDLRKNREPENGFLMLELLKEARVGGKNAVIESVRAIAEVEFLRAAEPTIRIWAVDADQRIRYERTTKRRSDTDGVTFEKFCEQEARESEGKEPWRGNLPACIRIADVRFSNNGTKEEFEAEIEQQLELEK